MSAASQWTTIGWMMLCGVCMGTAFDLYRVSFRRFRLPRWLLPALDFAYWAAALLTVFHVLRSHNHGEVRLYVFLGLGIGVTGYFGIASSWVVKASGWLLDTIIGIAAWAWKMFRLLVVSPILYIVRLLAKLLDVIFVVIAALLLWVGKLLLVPLRPVGRYLWAKLLPLRRAARRCQAYGARFVRKVKSAWTVFKGKS